MKKNAANNYSALSLRRLTACLGAWIHQWIGKKAAYLDDCSWYPGPCQTEFYF